MDTRTKILGRKELAKRLNEHKSRGEEIVLTNGCFDILHVGHSRYLTGAKSEVYMLYKTELANLYAN